MHIDIHALQTMPLSNLNRDMQGSPKTCEYGGSTRTRVSSQSWKRAVRGELERGIDSPTLRTRRIAGAVRDALLQPGHGFDEETARKAGRAVMVAADAAATRKGGTSGGITPESTDDSDTSKVLFWLPQKSIAELAELCAAHHDAIAGTVLPDPASSTSTPRTRKQAPTKADVVLPVDQVDAALGRSSPSIDLLGRMLAEMPGHRVDGATLFAHAFTTHEEGSEFDFFTAVDDIADPHRGLGSGHLNTAEFTSGVFYRYSSVNVGDLASNIDGDTDQALQLIARYLHAFCTAVPSGKQRSTAAVTIPELVHIAVRHAPLSLAAAFEQPVQHAPLGGYAEPSRQRLDDYAQRLHQFLGSSPLWSGYATVASDQYPHLGARSQGLPELIAEATHQAGDAA